MPFFSSTFTLAPTSVALVVTAEAVTVDAGPVSVTLFDFTLSLQNERLVAASLVPISVTVSDQFITVSAERLTARRLGVAVPQSRGALITSGIDVGAVIEGAEGSSTLLYFALLDDDGVSEIQIRARPLAGFAVLLDDGVTEAEFSLLNAGIPIDDPDAYGLSTIGVEDLDTWREMST